MPINPRDGQFVPSTPLVRPEPVLPGTAEERFERHRHRFLRLPLDLDEFNRMRSYAAFRAWHHRAILEYAEARRVRGKGGNP